MTALLRFSLGLLVFLLQRSSQGLRSITQRKCVVKPLYLEADEIIDNDADQLNKLRIQLQLQIQTPSVETRLPNREIANRIKAFFLGKMYDNETVERFKKYLGDNEDSLDFSCAVGIMDGIFKAGISLGWMDWNVLEAALARQAGVSVTSTTLTKCFMAIAGLKLNDAQTKMALKLLWLATASAGSEVLLSPSEACSCLSNLHNIRIQSTDLSRFIGKFAAGLERYGTPIPAKSICSALHGLRRTSASPIAVRRVLAALTRRVTSMEAYFHSVNVCIAINGLQNMDDSFPEVRSVLSALVNKSVSSAEQGMQMCKDREISMALFGLQRMGIQHDPYGFPIGSTSTSLGAIRVSTELKGAIVYLTSLLKHYTGPFEAKRVGFCLIGLSGIPNDLTEAKELIAVMTEKTKAAVGDISGQEMSMCLRGLINLRSDYELNRRLMLALVPLMQRCGPMKSNDISSAMIGLQSMRLSDERRGEFSSDGKSTPRIDLQVFFSAFAEMNRRSASKFDTVHDAARGLYGLQSAISDTSLSREIKEILPVMLNAVSINRDRENFVDSRDIAMLVYALRSTNSKSDSSKHLLSSVANLLDRILKGDQEAILLGNAPLLSSVRMLVSPDFLQLIVSFFLFFFCYCLYDFILIGCGSKFVRASAAGIRYFRGPTLNTLCHGIHQSS